MKNLACNTSVHNTSCTAAEWIDVMKEVGDILQEMNDRGAPITMVRWVCGTNEITPCNVDRELWFFRITGKDAEAAANPGFLTRFEHFELRKGK